MNDQTIPAEKVRELIEKFKEDTKHDCIVADLRALLPAPPQPTSGLFGKWAKHPEHGDVMCIWGKPDSSGHISVHWAKKGGFNDVEGRLVLLSDLTFPHQANRPAEVQPGEAWRIRDTEGNEFNAVKTSSGYYTTDRSGYTWLFCDHDGNGHWLKDKEVTLVCPLTPERPVSDLQAKYDELDKNWCYLDTKYSALRKDYDELDAKYAEAQEKIKALEQANLHPPFGTKTEPAWRIEHDHTNLRVGDYIIDREDDDGTVTKKDEKCGWWLTDSMALGSKTEAPFIVFTNRSAATPEAVAEAKKARDKEMDK